MPPNFDDPLSSGTIGGETKLSVGPYSLSLLGTVSNKLDFAGSFGGGTASVDYPINASVELPTNFEPDSSFTIDTGETGHGALDLSTDWTLLASLALTDTLMVHLAGQAVLPFTSPITVDQNFTLADLSVGVDFVDAIPYFFPWRG